ncbi:MAG: PDZ domain-containing protein [Candidatus Cloacimonadota bacterium]|nr:PDZ domain-containing protein [Candidatus Cloacimonadota bacterium]
MKIRKGLLVLLGLLLVMNVFAQNEAEIEKTIDEAMEEVDNAMEEIATELDDNDEEIIIKINNRDNAFMGIVTKDVYLYEARKLDYQYDYGIKITTVTKGSPANLQKIRTDDILMEIGNEKIKNDKMLSEILGSYKVGDSASIKLFREGEIIDLDFTFGSRYSENGSSKDVNNKPKKKRAPRGFGGGGIIPIYYQNNFDDANKFLADSGLDGLNQNVILYGGGGMGYIGNGFFIGGMGAAYEQTYKTGHTVSDTIPVIRRVKSEISLGGVTLDRRFGISKYLTAGVGLTLGGLSHRIQISQTDGEYNWLSMNNSINNSANNYVNIQKDFVLIHPKVNFMVRLTSWLRIRAEVGYAYTYAVSPGWKVQAINDDFSIENSPDTDLSSLTFSVGPWFGF